MKLDYKKGNGLIPVIIQEANTGLVLMLGYMNEEAFQKTRNENRVCFYSRTKNRLWTKGESSGNYLNVVSMEQDCDQDTLLIQVKAEGPTCHLGTSSCFKDTKIPSILKQLENTIADRIEAKDANSYSYNLSQRGMNKVAQKVGEEAVELVIEALGSDDSLFLNEAADLMYHYLLLLQNKNFTLADVEKVLAGRMK
jgi:phosphoribosyl-AMP cyclohydrolase / phosphoribosyl-ATP pyrophosphohydrolase